MNVSMILSQASYFQKLQPASKLASSQVVATFTSHARRHNPTKIQRGASNRGATNDKGLHKVPHLRDHRHTQPITLISQSAQEQHQQSQLQNTTHHS